MEEFGVGEIVATLGLSLFVLYVELTLNTLYSFNSHVLPLHPPLSLFNSHTRPNH